MNSEKPKNLTKTRKIIFALLAIVFAIGLLTKTTEAFKRTSAKLFPPIYEVIDLHINDSSHGAVDIEEGFAAGNSKFIIQLNDLGTFKLISQIEKNPNAIYLIRLTGSTPIEEHWLGGLMQNSGNFSLELVTIKPQPPYTDGSEWVDNMILHFPSVFEMSGWNSFNDTVLNCCSNTFTLVGFYRFVNFREKGDNMNQYKLQFVTPEIDKASETIKMVSDNSFYNFYTK